MKFHYPDGSTPLDPDEIEELVPSHITRQDELNEWEQENIIKAEIWAFSNKHSYQNILMSDFVRKIHQKMFDLTWKWAGKFRKTLKTIGSDPFLIATELKILLEDTQYQIEHHTYSIDEIAYRFHHRLVKIHPFSNGNGRHARLITDLLLINLDQPRFSWGQTQLTNTGPARNQYIDALRKADRGDYCALAQFVRS